MRVSIRNQLAALVLISLLVGLAVVSIATWLSNHPIYVELRSSRMSTIASLKASQLSSNLELMERSVRAMATRVKLQATLHDYNLGNNTEDNWSPAMQDLISAMSGDLDNLINLQTIIFPRALNVTGSFNNGSAGILNTTAPAVTGLIALPWVNSNGSQVYLGDNGTGYPPSLYPNLTWGDDIPAISYSGETLGMNSALLLGPLLLNESFSLFSITLPIINNTSETDILGWMTVVQDGNLIMDVINSPVGLGETGTTLLIAANTTNQLLPTTTLTNSQAAESAIPNITFKFVLPPNEQSYEPKRHAQYEYGLQSTFPASSYPTVAAALVYPNNQINAAGAVLSTYNEEGYDVALGYAIPSSNLCHWLVVMETTKAEAYQLITLLQNTLLACVFGTAAVAAILIFPLAHYSSRPIRRLRDATSRVANPTAGSLRNNSEMVEKPVVNSNGVEKNGLGGRVKALIAWRFKLSSDPEKPPGFDDGRAANNVPQRVKDGKHYLEDELTDLTTTFNEMSDELALQYARLEERVRVRTAELEQSKKAAEAANESKSLFIANISHELKTPLNGILGMTTLCMQEEDPTKIKRTLDIIYKSGDLLNALLTDLLTFSKHAMAKGLTLDEKEFRLRDIKTQLSAIFQAQAKENKVDFAIFYEGPCDLYGNIAPHEEGEYGPEHTGKVRDMILWGDSQRLLQVAINLISNSLKFTPEGGVVNLSIRCVERVPNIVQGSSRASMTSQRPTRQSELDSLSHELDGSALKSRLSFASGTSENAPPENATTLIFEFAVEDTGPGIPHHLQDQIFLPFVQGDLRLTKKFGGTGLGLSICQQICKLMRGTLTLKSEVGVGSTFTLRIPLRLIRTRVDSSATSTHDLTCASNSISRASSPAPHLNPGSPKRSDSPGKQFETDTKPRLVGLSQPFFSTGKPPMASPSSDDAANAGNKLRVLVAEDNVVNAEVVTRMLKLEEVFDVTLAKDGQEAFDKVQESMKNGTQYDLIFMDIQMPLMDGRQSTRLIRQAGYNAPIVALTAFSDEINQKECLDSGMDFFLAKPIKRPALKHVLKTYCTPVVEEEEPPEDGEVQRTTRSRGSFGFGSGGSSPMSSPLSSPLAEKVIPKDTV